MEGPRGGRDLGLDGFWSHPGFSLPCSPVNPGVPRAEEGAAAVLPVLPVPRAVGFLGSLGSKELLTCPGHSRQTPMTPGARGGSLGPPRAQGFHSPQSATGRGQPSARGGDKHLSFATSQPEGQLQVTRGVSLGGSQSSGGRRGRRSCSGPGAACLASPTSCPQPALPPRHFLGHPHPCLLPAAPGRTQPQTRHHSSDPHSNPGKGGDADPVPVSRRRKLN